MKINVPMKYNVVPNAVIEEWFDHVIKNVEESEDGIIDTSVY